MTKLGRQRYRARGSARARSAAYSA